VDHAVPAEHVEADEGVHRLSAVRSLVQQHPTEAAAAAVVEAAGGPAATLANLTIMAPSGSTPGSASGLAGEVETLDPVPNATITQQQLHLQASLGGGGGGRASLEGNQDRLIPVASSPARATAGAKRTAADPRRSYESAPAALFVPITTGSAPLGPGPSPPEDFSQRLSVLASPNPPNAPVSQGLGGEVNISAGDLLITPHQQGMVGEQGFLSHWQQQARSVLEGGGAVAVGPAAGTAAFTAGAAAAPGVTKNGDAGSSSNLEQSLVGMLTSASNESHPLAALTKVEQLQQQMERIQQQLSEMRARALHRHISSKSSVGQ
jgi:hypothetical protein